MKAGPELDALIATKVMGWTLNNGFWDGGDWFVNEDNATCEADLGWRPSTDIACAWEVVEKVATPSAFWLDYDLKGNWAVTFADDSPRNEALAPTAPLAICLAALKAVATPSRRNDG